MQIIETECPNCHAPYRLKDRMIGKPVTCATPSCRKTFTVTAKAGSNGTPPPSSAETLPGSTATPPGGVPVATVPVPPPVPPKSAPEPVAKKPSETAVKPVPKPPEPVAKKPSETGVKPVAKAPDKPAPPKPPEPPAKTVPKPPPAPAAKSPGLTVIPPKPPSAPKKDDDDDDALGSLFTDPPPVTSGPVSLNTRAFAELMAAEKAEAPVEVPVQSRTIPMTCAMCDHKWEVGFDKQGKNAPCPECRHINKVPEQKEKANWRDANTKKPSLAKQDELPADVMTTTKVAYAGAQALKEAGAIVEDIEPRPTWHYAALAATVFLVIGGLAFGIVSFRSGRVEDRHERLISEAQKDLLESKDVPPTEAPLFKAAFHLAAGEYEFRGVDDAHLSKLKAARDHYDSARQELVAAHKCAERDVLFSELAVAQLALAGTPEQEAARTRARWVPRDSTALRSPVKSDDFDVQTELRKTLTAMQTGGLDFDARAAAVRRLARELAKTPRPDLLNGIFQTAFTGAEVPEMQAQLAVELMRSTGDKDRARATADDLKTTLKAATGGKQPATPPMVVALWKALDPPVSGPTPAPPAATGEVSDEQTLFAYTALALLQGKPEDAAKLAARGAKPDAKLRALALVAEWAPSPADAVKAAADVAKVAGAPEKKKEVGPLPAGPLLRLAQAAARNGQTDALDPLVKAIPDEGTRAFAHAEAFRLKLNAAPDAKPAEESALEEIPGDPKKLRLGHAWARLALARNNAKATGAEDKMTVAGFDKWGKHSVAPFGLVGLQLGLQDRR